jgi:hypothetical protein
MSPYAQFEHIEPIRKGRALPAEAYTRTEYNELSRPWRMGRSGVASPSSPPLIGYNKIGGGNLPGTESHFEDCLSRSISARRRAISSSAAFRASASRAALSSS